MLNSKFAFSRMLVAMVAALSLFGCSDINDDPDTGRDSGVDLGSDAARICEVNSCQPGTVGQLHLGYGIQNESGVVVFQAIEDGTEVEIVPGFQGGQHIWIVLRAENISTCWVSPTYQILDDGAEPVLDARFGGEFYELADQDGMYEFLAYAAFVETPSRVHRQTVTLRAEVSDGCGNQMVAELEVVPVDARLDVQGDEDPDASDMGGDVTADVEVDAANDMSLDTTDTGIDVPNAD